MGSESAIPVCSEGIAPAGGTTHEFHQGFPVMLPPSLPYPPLRLRCPREYL